MFYKISRQNNSLEHHGILGMKWGIRRYQNKDGSLTAAGKKRYYESDEYGFKRLTKKGVKYNESQKKSLNRYKDSTRYNVEKLNPEFKKELENYNNLRKANSEDYKKNLNDWMNAKGKFSNKDYYEFKNASYDNWVNSDLGKKENQSFLKLQKMINDAAKEHPLYNKSFKQLMETDISHITNDPVLIKKVNYGKEVVNSLMRDIKYDYIKNRS